MPTRTHFQSLDPNGRKLLRRALLRWYDGHSRDLPWRLTRDPYRVWVSEIMLQQTRVAAVLDYYKRFLELFPDVESLSRAELAAVLAAWSGLGYYRRARAMHAAAKVVASNGGVFPRTPMGLAELPGIGRYTAAAIASIAFQHPAAVVDGNVKRVLARMYGRSLEAEESWRLAGELLSTERPGDWNQAVMELGATVCVPVNPDCSRCPVNRWCASKGATESPKQAPRYKKDVTFALARRGQSVLLVQRPATDSLMAEMWELPCLQKRNGETVLLRVKHSITNSDYAVTVVEFWEDMVAGGEWISVKRLDEIPLTGLARKILRRLAIVPESAAPKD